MDHPLGTATAWTNAWLPHVHAVIRGAILGGLLATTNTRVHLLADSVRRRTKRATRRGTGNMHLSPLPHQGTAAMRDDVSADPKEAS